MMRRFLQSVWQLWYQIMHQPLKLQERADDISSNGNRALFWKITLHHVRDDYRRLIVLVVLLCLPLFTLIAVDFQYTDLLFLGTTLLATYNMSRWYLSLGIHVPLFFCFVYFVYPESVSDIVSLLPFESLPILSVIGFVIIIALLTVFPSVLIISFIGISQLPVPLLMFSYWLMGFCLYSLHIRKTPPFIAIVILMLIGITLATTGRFVELGLGFFMFLIGYIRFHSWVFYSVRCNSFLRSTTDQSSNITYQYLYRLPPYIDNVYRIAIVKHSQLLRRLSTADMPVVHDFLSNVPQVRLEGYQVVLDKSIPSIMKGQFNTCARYLAEIDTAELLLSEKTRAYLTGFSSNLKLASSLHSDRYSLKSINLPKIQNVLEDIRQAMYLKDKIAKDHALGKCVDQLSLELSPAFGMAHEILDASVDWKSIVSRWRQILEREISNIRTEIVIEYLSNVETIDDIVNVFLSSNSEIRPLVPSLYQKKETVSSSLLIDPVVKKLLPRLRDIAVCIQNANTRDSYLEIHEGLSQCSARLYKLRDIILDSKLRSEMIRQCYPMTDKWGKIVQEEIRSAQVEIIAEQFKKISNIRELVKTAEDDHPILSTFLPKYYRIASEDDVRQNEPSNVLPDTAIPLVIPGLKAVARDISAALEFEQNSPVLKEKLLQKGLFRLQSLERELHIYGSARHSLDRWLNVIKHWYEVVDLEIKTQVLTTSDEVINPFETGNPLLSERRYLFKGRKNFAAEVMRQILNHNRPTLVLHGPRRCGKTSFLRNLSHLLPNEIIPVYIDMQNVALINNENDFCYGIVKAIHKTLASNIQDIHVPSLMNRSAFQTNPYAVLQDWLDSLLIQLKPQHSILLCLDEFERLGTAIAQGRLSLHVFDQLRHLIQHTNEMGFLFCGVQILEELGPNWSSYFISVYPMEMVYLEQDEAVELLQNPDPEFKLHYEKDVIDEVMALTRCQPYLLQLVGSSMVKQANLNNTTLITSSLLDSAVETALATGRPYFDNLWQEYTGTTPEEITAGKTLLSNLAQGKPLSTIYDPNMDAALDRLIRYHVIEYVNGNYYFEVPLVEQWVREYTMPVSSRTKQKSSQNNQ